MEDSMEFIVTLADIELMQRIRINKTKRYILILTNICAYITFTNAIN